MITEHISLYISVVNTDALLSESVRSRANVKSLSFKNSLNVPWEWFFFVTCLNADYCSPEEKQSCLYFEEECLGIFNRENKSQNILLSDCAALFYVLSLLSSLYSPTASHIPSNIPLNYCNYLDPAQRETGHSCFGVILKQNLKCPLCIH